MSTLSAIAPLVSFDEVKTELYSMGLSEEVFENAFKSALYLYKRVSPLHPLSTAGSRFWEEVVAVLRAGLLTNEFTKWGSKHEDGLSLTCSLEHRISIVVTSGNKYAGLSDARVKTKNSKGPSTLAYVSQNQDLFYTAEGVEGPQKFAHRADPNETWVLLYHIDKAQRVVRSELSLPKQIHHTEGRLTIDEWEKRIILPEISYDSTLDDTTFSNGHQGFTPAIDFSGLTNN